MTSHTFTAFRAELLRILQTHWRPPHPSARLRAVIAFGLERNGRVLFAELRRSSGDDVHDQQALSCVNVDSRFPPLPGNVTENTVFAFNFDSDPDELLGAGVPLVPRTPVKETEVSLDEPLP